MTEHFITYAQNAEDVMLWRALKDVQRGFYIDVGAQDPVVDSVTKAFYERGWHGINIEPVTYWFERLAADRPHDVNLQVAASDAPGELALYEVVDTGLSTCDPEFAQRHQEQGREIREIKVPCRTLDEICKEHGVDTVHFLKVDCEGAEKASLTGMSFEAVRPWVVVVEATEPNITTPTHQEWEHLLLQRDYEFVYFDGLNRFYLASEHAELRKFFSVPANVLDWASRFVDIQAHAQIEQLTAQVSELRSAERYSRAVFERDSYWGEKERLEADIGKLREGKQARDEEVVGLVADGAALREENARLKAATDKSHEEQRLRDEEIAGLVADGDALREENARLKAATDKSHEEQRLRDEEIAGLVADGAALREENARLKAATDKSHEEQRLRDEEIAGLVADGAALREENARLNAATDKLHDDQRIRGEEIARLVADGDALREENASLKAATSKSHEEQRLRDEEIAGLAADGGALRAENAHLKAAMDKFHEEQRLRDEDVSGLAADGNALREENARLNVDLGKLREERLATQQANKTLADQVERLAAELEQANIFYGEVRVALGVDAARVAGMSGAPHAVDLDTLMERIRADVTGSS